MAQDAALSRLESFLGFGLARIAVNAEAVGRWKNDKGRYNFDFFLEDLLRYGYEA